MSDYQNPHDDDNPRFEPWLGAIASSFLPWVAAFYLPKAFVVPLATVSGLLFMAGLVMLRIQTVREKRERQLQPDVR